jgi:hypothetical protein
VRKRSADRARKHKEAVHDAFAEFRNDPVEPARGTVRLVPLAAWARVEKPPQEAPATVPDELRELMKGLAIRTTSPGVTYARGCRIRRVRVAAVSPPAREKGPKIRSSCLAARSTKSAQAARRAREREATENTDAHRSTLCLFVLLWRFSAACWTKTRSGLVAPVRQRVKTRVGSTSMKS